MQQRDDSWFIFASSELGVPETVLQDYARNGNSLSLAILTHVTRQQFNHLCERWPREAFSKVLQAASQFDVLDTLPGLQHEFCALWNEIVLKAQNDNNQSATGLTLGMIRHVYIALHQDSGTTPTRFFACTDYDEILWDPSSYPLCDVPCHRHDSTPHIHDNSASTSIISRTVLHNNTALVPANPNAPSSSTPAPLPVGNSLTDVPPLDNATRIPGSFHPVHQTTIENFRILATSQDQFATRMEQDSDTSTTTTSLFTLERSTSTPPTSIASALPSESSTVRTQDTADCRTSLDVLDMSSPLSPTPLLQNMFYTDSDTHSSTVTPNSLGLFHLRQSSAHDFGAVGEGEGSAKVGLSKERDALRPSSASPDLTPLLPSPPPITDLAIAGPSRRSLDSENPGGLPLHSPYDQYNIV
ncbi:hypothetical protein EI94DRAFT_537376 [Lactarius quietus]|nr:hypothetical protein EI94DRAFT_537376 [Lactarius quietus]